ncbi:MAG: 2OG-Fe(II) oxygenase family protein [Pseudomonadota bacterium]
MSKLKTALLYIIAISCTLFPVTFAAEFTEGSLSASAANSTHVSIIDLQSPDASEKFLESLRKTGFALFKNHGIDTTSLTKDWEEFYSSSDEYKMQKYFKNDPASNALGYYPYAAERAEGAAAQNKMEYYHDAAGHELPDCISDETKSYFSDMETIKIQLSRMIDQEYAKEGFQLPERLRSQGIDSVEKMSQLNLHSSVVRILHYPALAEASDCIGEVVNLEHTDISAFSLLFATEPGLQLQARDGSWHGVGGGSDILVVNAGDMLMWGTDGHLPENRETGIKSTVHRVIRFSTRARFAFAAFFGVKPWIQILPEETALHAFNKRIGGNLTAAAEGESVTTSV